MNKILFPNSENPLDISKINTMSIIGGSGSGWSDSIFALVAHILNDLQNHLVIYDTRLVFDLGIERHLQIPIQKKFDYEELRKIIDDSTKNNEHIFLMFLEITDVIDHGDFEKLTELANAYRDNDKVHFIFQTNRAVPGNHKPLDSLLKASNCLVAFKMADDGACSYYLENDCPGAFQNVGDMVVKFNGELKEERGEKFEEKDFQDYLSQKNL